MKRLLKALILPFVYFGTSLVSVAQPTGDTTQVLQEVVITGKDPVGGLSARSYSVGTHTIRYTEKQLQTFRQQSLSDFLQSNSAIYFKEYGKGMTSTIALRGTSASQTSVQWNGVNINIPSMGTMDFSHLPLFFFDAVEIHAGGESAVYGSGSIGGNVQLNTYAQYKPGIHAEIQQNIGSFGYLFSGALFRIANQRWESRTSAIYNTSNNNYEFTDNTSYGHPRTQLNNAGFRNYGILEELYFRPSKDHELSARFWYADFKRDIQPLTSMNDRPAEYHRIYDHNLRAIVSYKATINSLKLNVNAGYASDYEKFKEDIIATNKIIGATAGEYTWKHLTVKAGMNVEYIKAATYAYAAGTDEWRSDVFLQLRWLLNERWTMSSALRQYFVTNVNVPLSPSCGLSYLAIRTTSHNLKIRAAASYNIKIPSLNDLYWGGTISLLRPEKGWNSEIGTDYTLSEPSYTFKANVTGYFNRIDDWIRWLPIGSIWKPKNVGLVNSYGIEVATGTLVSLSNTTSIEMYGNYAYTSVILEESNTINDPNTGIQVAFQPEHCFNITMKAIYDKFSLQAITRYTGQRHTQDQFDSMPSYTLVDLSAEYLLEIRPVKLFFSLQCNNLFDKDYQNIKNFAMPGRSFNANLRIQF